MKKLWILVAIPMAFVYCLDRNHDKMAQPFQADKPVVFKDTTTVKIIDSAYNFGTVAEGVKVAYSYRFVNTGHVPLIVTKASPSCGCTVADAPKEPIQTGDTGYIKIVFNSEGRIGQAHKTIHVTSNAFEDFPDLLLTGVVVAADK